MHYYHPVTDYDFYACFLSIFYTQDVFDPSLVKVLIEFSGKGGGNNWNDGWR